MSTFVLKRCGCQIAPLYDIHSPVVGNLQSAQAPTKDDEFGSGAKHHEPAPYGKGRASALRDLVERYPETMEILAPLGIDLCCGGGHPLGEALDLHGLDRESVIPRVAAVVEASPERRAE